MFQLSKAKKDKVWGILLLIPALFFISILILYPIMNGVWLSFHKLYLLTGLFPKFIGLANFTKFWKTPESFLYLKNTLIWLGGTISGQFIVGMTLALLLNRKMKFRSLYRGLAIIPWTMPVVATGIIWRWILDGEWGILNYILIRCGLIDNPIMWLSDPGVVWFSLLMVSIWKFFPFWFINILAGLQVIPQELYEAGRIDGTSKWTAFLYISLPHLSSIIAVLFLLQTIWCANEFPMIWVMTQGGPGNATMTLAPFIYLNSFRYYRMGYGASLGTLLMFFSLTLTIIYLSRYKTES